MGTSALPWRYDDNAETANEAPLRSGGRPLHCALALRRAGEIAMA
jgi:hypothetical protein